VSSASLGQIAHAARTQPVRAIDLSVAVSEPEREIDALVDWVRAQDRDDRPVVCAARVRADVVSERDGIATAGFVEAVLAGVARELVVRDIVDGLVVAGGETSGAVIRELGVASLQIGPEIDPGVCWARATTPVRTIAVALKSGNFGGEDFFTAAWGHLR